MNKSYHTPDELIGVALQSGINKTSLPLIKLSLLAILAGAFVALGAQGSSVAMHGITNVSIARVVGGVVFPVGLMMIVLTGGELFTSNCLISIACLDKQVRASRMIVNLVVVYLSNMVGAAFIALMIFGSGQLDYSHGGLGAYTIKVALGKVNISSSNALISGILCNILVCIAILMAYSAKDIIGKVFAMFFPIFVFVISGFEHCIANMYYIPAGILAATNKEYVLEANTLYGITADQISNLNLSNMFLNNLLPVTIGNIIGGVCCVGAMYYVIFKRNKSN